MLKLNPKRNLLVLICAAILLSSCKEEIPENTSNTPKVATQALAELLIDYNFYRPARVISLNDSLLSTQLNAPVEKIHAKVGDYVEKGAPLIALNCSDEQHRLQQASAQLAASKANTQLSELDLQRGQKLFKQQSISEQELNRLQSSYDRDLANQSAAAATYAISKNNVGKCTIRAPFNAVVMQRSATLGQLANPGTTMIRVLDADNLEVSVFLDSDEANTIRQSDKVYFLENDKKYPVQIRAITPAVDNIRRTQEIRLTFTQEKPLPGSAGELVWQHYLPAIPTEYLSQRDGKLGLLYAENRGDESVAAFAPIAGALEGQPAAIRYDDVLKADTAILTDGRFSININDAITLISPESE